MRHPEGAVLRTALYLALAILPWPLLAWQEHARYTDAKVHIWPATTIIAVLFLVGLLALQWGSRAKNSAEEPVPPLRGRAGWRHAIAAALLVGGGIHLLSELRRICRVLWFNPITPTQADMLPLIQSAVRVFVRDHESPYRYHEVASWGMHLTFTPGLWLPFSIPYSLGLDFRVWCAIASVLTAMLLLIKGTLHILGSRTRTEMLAAVPAVFAAFMVTQAPHLKAFTPALHVSGMWLVLAAWGIAVGMRRQFAAGFFLGMVFITRPYTAFVLPFYVAHCLLNLRQKPRMVILQGLGMCIPAAIAIGFLLPDPHAYFYGPAVEYDAQLMPQAMNNPMITHGFGFTAALREAGVIHWRMPLTVICEVLLLIFSLRMLKRPNDLILAVAAGLFVVLSFTIVPWHYVFIDVLVLLAIWSPGGTALPLPSARGRGVGLVAFYLFSLFVVGTVVREVGRPPVRVPAHESPVRELAKLRRGIAGFDDNAWALNDGTVLKKMLETNCYVGFPVYRSDSTQLEVELENRSGAEFSLRLLANTQLLGIYKVPPGRQIVRVQAPPGTLFRGLNTLRLERLGTPPGEIFLARVSLVGWNPPSPP